MSVSLSFVCRVAHDQFRILGRLQISTQCQLIGLPARVLYDLSVRGIFVLSLNCSLVYLFYQDRIHGNFLKFQPGQSVLP